MCTSFCLMSYVFEICECSTRNGKRGELSRFHPPGFITWRLLCLADSVLSGSFLSFALTGLESTHLTQQGQCKAHFSLERHFLKQRGPNHCQPQSAKTFPSFDCLHHAKTEREGLIPFITRVTSMSTQVEVDIDVNHIINDTRPVLTCCKQSKSG